MDKNLREEVRKHRTYWKTFHRGFGKGTTEGDIAERLGAIKVELQKWPDDVLIFVRDLKEILGRCGYYLSEDQIRKLSREGFLKGKKIGNLFWYYPKFGLYDWVTYLKQVGLQYLIRRGIIKEEDKEDLLALPKRNRARVR